MSSLPRPPTPVSISSEPLLLFSSESLLPTIAFASLLASFPHCSLPHPHQPLQ
jgi:hypothetical protein